MAVTEGERTVRTTRVRIGVPVGHSDGSWWSEGNYVVREVRDDGDVNLIGWLEERMIDGVQMHRITGFQFSVDTRWRVNAPDVLLDDLVAAYEDHRHAELLKLTTNLGA